MKNKYYPNLASPITINGVTFKNRIFGAPMSNPELDPDCHMRKEDVAFHENRARGGLASVAIGLGIGDAVGRTHTKEVTLYDVKSLPSLKEAAKAMHRHNCNAVMELAHGGKYANARGHGEASEHYALGPQRRGQSRRTACARHDGGGDLPGGGGLWTGRQAGQGGRL